MNPVGLDREKAPGEKTGVKKENEISPFGQSRVKSTRKEERVRGRVLSRLSRGSLRGLFKLLLGVVRAS